MIIPDDGVLEGPSVPNFQPSPDGSPPPIRRSGQLRQQKKRFVAQAMGKSCAQMRFGTVDCEFIVDTGCLANCGYYVDCECVISLFIPWKGRIIFRE